MRYNNNFCCTECPPDFIELPDSPPYPHHCYKLVNQNLEWSVAGLYCRALHKDAHLVVINDQREAEGFEHILLDHSQFIVHVLLYCWNLEF